MRADGSLRSIPRRRSGGYDWKALPDGNYYVEWYEDGKRRRERAGSTVAEVQEAQRHKRHELEGRKLGLSGSSPKPQTPKSQPIKTLVERFLSTSKR